MWSAADSFASQAVNFVVMVVLARILMPREFGLMGMTAIFIAISATFVNSGLASALIRKKDCSQADYATVFYYNLGMGVLFYAILFLSAGAIAGFFDEPLVKPMVRVLGLDLIIRSLSIIQNTRLVKRIDFRQLAKVSVTASVLSGAIGILMALQGYGVWSLVARMVAAAAFTTALLWLWNRWWPSAGFSRESFKELFGFGSKLLASSLLDTAAKNIYQLVIGRFYAAQDLGFYTQAKMFKDVPAVKISQVTGRVTYPVLSEIRDEPERLKKGYRHVICTTTFLSFSVMALMAATAEPLIITLIGEKWRTSILYLQMLCFVGMMYPLHATNLNMLKVQGRSDLFLKLELIKKLLIVPAVLTGIFYGIVPMIGVMMINNVIAYFLNSSWSGRLVSYPVAEQLRDVYPAFLVAVIAGAAVYLAAGLMPFGYTGLLIAQLLLGSLLIVLISEGLRLSSYLQVKEIATSKIKSLINRKSTS